jgi:hypothetical protein
MKVKIRCKKCGYTEEAELRLNPLGSMKPGSESMGKGIKLDKDSLDKILATCKGASLDDLAQIGIQVDIDEWESAQERLSLRRFLLDNLKLAKEKRLQRGEKYAVATETWKAGDSFRDIDLSSSEVKSMGVDDLRMIPGLTMQKKVYGTTKGRDTEELKGIKFLVIIDGSGSMFSTDDKSGSRGKVGKALLIGREIYAFTKKLGFEYNLALFSDRGIRVPNKQLKAFWTDASERASYGIWSGGTSLSRGLKEFSDDEYKDANVIIVSDMDLGDVGESKNHIIQLTKLTNSFKIILIEDDGTDLEEREKSTRDLFPSEINLKVMVFPISTLREKEKKLMKEEER